MNVNYDIPEEGGSPEVSAETVVTRKKPAQRRRIVTFVVVTLVNLGLLTLLWTQLLSPARPATQTDTSSADALGDISSPLIGQPAPAFALQSVTDTTKVSLADFKGKPVILDFWDSACGPCNDVAAYLQQTWQQRLQKQGIVFIGVDGPDTSTNARGFLMKYHISYQNVMDSVDGATGINYGVTGHPETIFINKEGIIVAKWIAPLNDKGWNTELAKLMK